VARGHDPREFVLLPFGGAGGLHACALAEQLSIPRILVPRHPGLLSAAGLVQADVIRDYSRTILRGAGESADLAPLFTPMVEQARAEMAQEQIGSAALQLDYALDLRYQGQSFEVTVPFGDAYQQDFHARHEARYGYRDEGRPVQIVTLRLRASSKGPRPQLTAAMPAGALPRPGSAELVIAGHRRTVPLWDRQQLPAGAHLRGPALLVEETATHLLAPGWQARVDSWGNLLLERGEGHA
jgi:N-methylhydantoinase A